MIVGTEILPKGTGVPVLCTKIILDGPRMGGLFLVQKYFQMDLEWRTWCDLPELALTVTSCVKLGCDVTEWVVWMRCDVTGRWYG